DRPLHLIHQLLPRAPNIQTELFRGLAVNSLMSKTMTADFVARTCDPPDEVRELFNDPPEDEECGFCPPVCEYVQNPIYINFHTRRIGVPILITDSRAESFNLKIVLHIDA